MNSTRTRVIQVDVSFNTSTRLLMNNFTYVLSHYIIIGSLIWNDSSAAIFKYFADFASSEF